jgi:hypothetical protein
LYQYDSVNLKKIASSFNEKLINNFKKGTTWKNISQGKSDRSICYGCNGLNPPLDMYIQDGGMHFKILIVCFHMTSRHKLILYAAMLVE